MSKSSRIEKRRQELDQLSARADFSGWWDSRKKARKLRSLKYNIKHFCRETNKDLKDLEDFLTSRDPNGVAKATSLASRIAIQFFDLLDKELIHYAELETEKELDTESTKTPTDNTEFYPDQASKDWADTEKNIKYIQDKVRPALLKIESDEDKRKIDSLSNLLETKMAALAMADPEKQNNIKHEIYEIFGKLKQSLIDAKVDLAKIANDPLSKERRKEIEKIAHNAITRWINHKLMSINPSKEDMMKLRCVELMHQTYTSSKNLINALNSSDIKNIKTSAKAYYIAMGEMLSRMGNLAKDYLVIQPTRTGKEVIRLTNKSGTYLTNIGAAISRMSEKYE